MASHARLMEGTHPRTAKQGKQLIVVGPDVNP